MDTTNKTPEEQCNIRLQRFNDAIAMKKPDSIPILLDFSYFLAEFGGITKQQLHEDYAKAQEVLEKAALTFQPDACMGVFGNFESGTVLGDKMIKWPGHGLGPNDSFQFVEGEYMKAEDYDDFLFDPADWGIRKLLPRTADKLAGLGELSVLGMSTLGTAYGSLGDLTNPKVLEAIDLLKEAAQVGMAAGMRMMESAQRMAALGFPTAPLFTGGMASAPFDAMSDTLRGMKGIMLDMHRRPDKLLAAIEKMRVMITTSCLDSSKKFGFKTAGSMLHRGSDGFMSLKQFEKFYWPSLKQMWLDEIEAGVTPFAFYEGIWDQRLDYLAELPKGKTIGWFQSSDIFKVKEKLGDTMCIMGGMPNSLLQGGTTQQVRDWTKRICQEVGKDGGFIMCTTIGEMEGSKPENVKAWVEATREFGQY